ncbi:CAP domain-containing protein [Cyathus striatus]|nr:CAP domain-containing protein [Cyathus striatus]
MFFVTLLSVLVAAGVFSTSFSVYAAPRPAAGHPRFLSNMRTSPFQIATFLNAHNSVRAAHNASALTWSSELAEKAGVWADNCQFKPTGGVLSDQMYGENIAAGTGKFSTYNAVEIFTQDEASYDPASPTYTHFTQVVWKSTTQLGCAVSRCDGIFDASFGKASLYVCLYNPVGNVIGEVLENVQF